MKKLDLYRSKLDLFDTQRGISLILKRIKEVLESNFNILEVRAPNYFFGAKESTIDDFINSRPLTFDSDKDYNIYTIFNNYTKWINKSIKELKIKNNNGIYTIANFIGRDESEFGKRSFENFKLLFLYKYENKDNVDLKAIELAEKIYFLISSLKKEINNYFPVLKEELPDKIEVINIKKLNYKDLLANLSDFKEDLLLKNKWNIFYLSSQYLKKIDLNKKIQFNNLEILFFSNYLNRGFELVTVKINELEQGFSILIELNLDYLFMLLLEKALIYEVQNNIHDQEIEEILKGIKISRL